MKKVKNSIKLYAYDLYLYKVRYIVIHICIFSFLIIGQRTAAQNEHLKHGHCGVLATKLEDINVTTQITSRSDVCIPIVFHIVYENADDNLTDEMVHAQLDQLNRDFGLLNENVKNVPSEFRPFMSNTGIRFCLVSEDPDGQETNGITRTQTIVNNIGTAIGAEGRRSIHYDEQGGKTGWLLGDAVNVWVGQMQGIIGYATFPEQAPFADEDGIIIDTDFFSPLNDRKPVDVLSKGHTLAHEMGHFLNLSHIWGSVDDLCDIDDGISDTPSQEGPNFGCPAHPVISCNTADMFMNFMDFSNDACIAFFTNEQSDRMNATLQSSRVSLVKGNVEVRLPEKMLNEPFRDVMTHYQPDCGEIFLTELPFSSDEVMIEVFSFSGQLLHQSVVVAQRTYRIVGLPSVGNILLVRLSQGVDFRVMKVLVH